MFLTMKCHTIVISSSNVLINMHILFSVYFLFDFLNQNLLWRMLSSGKISKVISDHYGKNANFLSLARGTFAVRVPIVFTMGFWVHWRNLNLKKVKILHLIDFFSSAIHCSVIKPIVASVSHLACHFDAYIARGFFISLCAIKVFGYTQCLKIQSEF